MARLKLGKSGGEVSAEDEAARYRALVEAITHYAIYMLDPKGAITSWNAGAERIKGYRAGEIISQNFAKFYTEKDAPAVHRRGSWRPRPLRESMRAKAGGCARMAATSGLMWLSIPSATAGVM
jgi:PAS domain-containing protein